MTRSVGSWVALAALCSACGGGGGAQQAAPVAGNQPGISILAGSVTESDYVDGAGSAARFRYPAGLTINSKGELFVADFYGDAIRKITPDGMVSTFAGKGNDSGADDGVGGAARFGGPADLTIDAADNLYVADSYALTVRKITPAAAVTTLFKLPQGVNVDGRSTLLFAPGGIAVDSGGNLYVTNGIGTRKVTPQGVTTMIEGVDHKDNIYGTMPLNQRGVAIDGSGTVVLHDLNQAISKIGAGGALVPFVAASNFVAPGGMAFDRSGNLYLADSGNNTIRKITPAGVVSTVAGVAGQTDVVLGPLPGHLPKPQSLVVGADGSLYVTAGSAVLKIRF